MSRTPLLHADVRGPVEASRRAGALLVPVEAPAMGDLLAATLADAARRQSFVPGYAAELRMWSGRYAASRDRRCPGTVRCDHIGRGVAVRQAVAVHKGPVGVL